METILFLLGLGVLVYVFLIDSRHKRDTATFEERFGNLTRELESLRHELHSLAATAAVPAVAPPPPSQAPAPSQLAAAHTAPPAYAPLVAPKPVTPPPMQSPAPAPTVAPAVPVRPLSTPPTVVPPPPAPATPQHAVAQTPRASFPPAEQKPAPPPPPPPAPAQPTSATPVRPPGVAVPPRPPIPAPAAPLQTAAHAAATAPARTVQPVVRKPKRSFEEVLGTKWLPIIGIIGVIISLGYLLSYGWGRFTAWERDLILYVGSFSLLAGGIFLEKKERYKNLGRVLIGGGWAATAAVTYAIGNRPHEQILPSPTVDLFLLLGVIAAMVWHTLKYRSQVVTGAAFLLGFVAIGMNPDPPYNLIAAAMLICGMTVIVWKYQWFELEVFGILASYINHFYWLYQVYEQQGQRAIFPYHSASVILVIVYWIIFRSSYLFRKISGGRQEFVSTFAGLLNPILFLAVMKYQGFHPEWAWWFLLVMGFVEFSLGQLPTSRRRRAPFQILSSLGATLIVAAPFVRGSGNALEVLWLICAEAFLLAGIFTRERLFRGFGLIISFLVAFYALPMRVVPLLRDVLTGQPHQVAQTGLILAAIALALYANAHLTRRFWPSLFEDDLEDFSLTALSFAASLFAVAAVYATVPDHVIAFALALFVLWLSLTGKLFSIQEVIYEAHWVAVVAFIQVIVADRALETKWFGIPQRILAFGSVAALLYLSSRFVRLSETQGKALFSGAYAWAGTALLTLLIWFHATSWAVGVAWIFLALALSLAGQALKRSDLKWQAFALVLLSSLRALTININLTATWPHLTYRLVSVSVIALGIYLLARWAPRPQTRPVYSVAGTLLLTVLAFKEAPAPWTAVAWVSLALLLSLAAR